MAGETVITVIGNLTADPELRFTPAGAAVATFTVASTPRRFNAQTNQWEDGARSRNSSQRGCAVSINSGNVEYATEIEYEYSDPEGWEPILARGARGGQHARSTPNELKYIVRFRFSREEYRKATRDAVLLDTPVFDDISITYMRRPKVLRWRDVTQ